MTITMIKFFYNGVKINGQKNLIKLNVWKYEDGTIEIENDWRLDRDFRDALLEVTDLVTVSARYYGDRDTMRIRVNIENPIYNCFKYMILAAKRKDLKKYGKDYSTIETEINTLPNAANETLVDAAKMYIVNVKAEREAIKKAEEEKEAAKGLAIFEAEKAEKETIITLSNLYPITEDAKYKVRICWSEHPAFYDWADNELEMSVKAADLVLEALDKKPEEGGYYKTKFAIIEDDDEENAYIGRYDLGDGDGGLIKHIEDFAAYAYKDDLCCEEYKAMTDFTAALRAETKKNDITVSVADGLAEFIKNFKKNQDGH